MIYIGQLDNKKSETINSYLSNNPEINKVFVLSPIVFNFELKLSLKDISLEVIKYTDIIMYKYFYRLLKEIDQNTLIVVNECLRTKNRYDLTYNCIRHFLNQTSHQLIFQYYPIITDIEDFMILFDFDTRSQWKRENFNSSLLDRCSLSVERKDVVMIENQTKVSPKTFSSYEKKKKSLIDNIGLKDPHTIPRNLLLIGGKEKLQKVEENKNYIGRNNRFKLDNLETYKKSDYSNQYSIFELCFNHRDFVDFLTRSRQTTVEVLTTDLKVDRWYFKRYQDWIKNLNDVYTKIQ